MEMTVKQRLLGSLRRQPVDQVPWSPFLAYWWDYQPDSVTVQGQLRFLESIGADPLLRGYGSLFTVKNTGCEETVSEKGGKRQTQLITPVGTLSLVHTYVEKANTWFLTEHPVKTKEDFKILAYIAEHMQIIPDRSVEQEADEIGDRALVVPQISPFGKSCFQSLIEYYVGTEPLVYALMDYPEAVEECLEAMKQPSMKAAEIAADSHMNAFIFWEDSSTTNLNPDMFDKYTAPELTQWASMLHQTDKLLVHHACGHIRDLLSNMCETGIDCIESISPPPTGNIELWDAQKQVGQQVSLVGGIEPTVFSSSSLEQLTEYVETLMNNMDHTGFILANSDSCPPDVSMEKFKLVTDWVHSNGCR